MPKGPINYTGKTCIIYARRSSEKDRDSAISISKQLEGIGVFCRNNGLVVLGEYQETKSSFQEGIRKEFNAMIGEVNARNIIGSKEGRVDFIIVLKLSRLARNPTEAAIISDYVRRGTVGVIALDEGIMGSGRAEERQQIAERLNRAYFDSVEKAYDAKRNMDKVYREGRLARTPPYGYRLNEWRRVVPDERDAECVRQIFKRYATGKYTYETLAKELNDEGFLRKSRGVERPQTVKDIEGVLIKDFYWGKVVVEYRNLTRDDIDYFQDVRGLDVEGGGAISIDYSDKFFPLDGTPGAYAPLVDYQVFKRCRDIREGKKMSGKEKLKGDYTWKGVLRCPCRAKGADITDKVLADLHTLTAETKKGVYKYYRCSHNGDFCENRPVSEEELDKQVFSRIISKIVPSPEDIEMFEWLVKERFKAVGEWRHTTNEVLAKKKTTLENTKRNYLKQVANSDNSEEEAAEFRKLARGCDAEIQEINNQIAAAASIAQDDTDKVKDRLRYFRDLSKDFFSFPREKRREIVRAIFDHIIYYQKNIVDFRLKKPFDGLLKAGKVLTRGSRVRKNEKPESNSQFPHQDKKKPSSRTVGLRWQPRSESN